MWFICESGQSIGTQILSQQIILQDSTKFQPKINLWCVTQPDCRGVLIRNLWTLSCANALQVEFDWLFYSNICKNYHKVNLTSYLITNYSSKLFLMKVAIFVAILWSILNYSYVLFLYCNFLILVSIALGWSCCSCTVAGWAWRWCGDSCRCCRHWQPWNSTSVQASPSRRLSLPLTAAGR